MNPRDWRRSFVLSWSESMADWRTTTFGQLGKLFDGPHATPTRTTQGPYFLNISSLVGGRLDLNLSDHVSPEDYRRWTRRVTPRVDDLLFSYETRLGEVALMPDGVEACLGRRMALLRPDRSVVDPRFLVYFYLSPQFQGTIATHTIQGATVPRIGLSMMPSWPVSIPELGEQRAIAEVLGALDDKTAANDRLVERADSLAGAITRRALSGDSVRLGDVASITMGSSPPGASYNEAGNGIPFYQGVRDFGARVPTRRVWTTAPVRLAEPGDTLLSVRAPVGRTNLAAEPLCLGRGLAALRSTLGHPMTLFHQVRSARSAWDPYEAEGTVFGAINRSQLESVRVPVVDPEKAPQVEERLVGLEELIGAVLAESTRLTETRDELLPLLTSGRLHVKDAERAVEEVV